MILGQLGPPTLSFFLPRQYGNSVPETRKLGSQMGQGGEIKKTKKVSDIPNLSAASAHLDILDAAADIADCDRVRSAIVAVGGPVFVTAFGTTIAVSIRSESSANIPHAKVSNQVIRWKIGKVMHNRENASTYPTILHFPHFPFIGNSPHAVHMSIGRCAHATQCFGQSAS